MCLDWCSTGAVETYARRSCRRPIGNVSGLTDVERSGPREQRDGVPIQALSSSTNSGPPTNSDSSRR